jgi:phenylacetate-CoA ligase
MKNIVKYITFPVLARREGQFELMRHVKDLDSSQYWPRDRILALQQQMLKSLLVHAYENTRYYRQVFDTAGFNPYAFKYHDEIKKIPTLTKNQIRENLDSLLARNYKKSQIHSAETGGTTGVKMLFYRDNACLSPKEASLYRFDKWAGWDFGEREGIVWPAQQDYVGHWTLKSRIKNAIYKRQVVFPAAIMDDSLISEYVKQLLMKKPVVIRAFTTPIYEVSRYVVDNKIDNIMLKGVITTGEPLYPHQRRLISQAFHCEVYDSYRCRDVGPIAQECSFHNGLHINSECLFIEIVASSPGIDENEDGEIIVTDLLNYGMPFIRYNMNDLGAISDELCACGRGLPLLKKVIGRTGDLLYTPNKKSIMGSSLVLYLVDEAPGLLGQVQIIQDRFDHLIIKMTNNPIPTQEILQYQTATIHRLFGQTMNVTFEFVDDIPLDKSGKYRFTICNLTPDVPRQ